MIESYKLPLVSLLEMLRKYGEAFYHIGSGQELIKNLLLKVGNNQESVAKALPTIIHNLEGAKLAADAAGLKFTVAQIDRTLSYCQGNCNSAGIRALFDELSNRIADELKEHWFFHVSPEIKSYYGNPKLFGDVVYEKYPSARKDIQDAGNCFALARYTPTVFHLMRVVEGGLRTAAKQLKVSLKTKTGTVSIDLLEWHGLITRIENKITDLQTAKRTKYKKVELQFWSEVAKEFHYFKDAWRNHTMHSYVHYDVHDAGKVMEHVRQFMQKLAERFGEVK